MGTAVSVLSNRPDSTSLDVSYRDTREKAASGRGQPVITLGDLHDHSLDCSINTTGIRSGKANGIDPFKYLRYLIETMPKLRRAQDVRCLLPWNTPLYPGQAESLAS